MTPSITYAITTHNEGSNLGILLAQLVRHLRDFGGQGQIVVVDDFSSDPLTLDILASYTHRYAHLIRFAQRALDGDFAAQKNHANTLCQSDFILQLDADELLTPTLLFYVRWLLVQHPGVDLFWLARRNIVLGMSEAQAQAWNFRLDANGWVNYPDYQGRLYRNCSSVVWAGHVHERIVGASTEMFAPATEALSIVHTKTVEQQNRGIELYRTLRAG